MKKKHIIFDFDGTIFDSNRVIVASWQEVFRHYTGKEGRAEDIYHTFGETIRYTVKKFFPQANVDEAVQIYRNYQQAHYDGMVELFDGTREMMDRMVEGGHTLSVVTSRTKVTTLDYMKELGIRDYFDVLITCDDTDKHKPDPTPLRMALEELSAKPEDAIMLGDTKFDIGCCNNAGVDSILVGWSHDIDEKELKELGFRPTYRVETPADVLKLI